jgi:hypothetical protein
MQKPKDLHASAVMISEGKSDELQLVAPIVPLGELGNTWGETMRAMVRAFILVTVCIASITVLAQGCGSSWEWLSPLPHGDNLYGAASGNGLLVAVGDLGRIQTSLDGRSWTYPAPITRQPLLDVCWGNGRWVAVGSGVILVSQDGTTWTTTSAGTTSQLMACTFADGQFVAVGWNGAILTSSDGLNWGARSSGTNSVLFNVTWGGGTFVAVGWGGTILTSPDGQHWALQTISGADRLRSCIYAGSYFLAATEDGHTFKSNDGTAWDSSGTLPFLMGIPGLYWDGSRILAYSPGVVATSTNGQDWSTHSLSSYVYLNGLAWNGAAYVIAGDGGTVLESSDAVSWTVLSEGSGDLHSMARGDSSFVAVGQGFIMSSPDGTNWEVVWNENGNVISDVTYAKGMFVAVSDERTVFTSTDGRTWRVRKVSPGPGWLTGVAFGNGRFVAVGDSGLIFTSTDGLHWTRRRMGTHRHGLTKVAWSGSRFVAVGYGGAVLTSADGIAWHHRTSGTKADLQDVSYGSLGFIAVGDSTFLTSQDGSSWTATSAISGDYPGFTAVAQGDGVAMVAGNGIALISRDGINWSQTAPPSGNRISGMTFQNGSFYAVGDQSSILRSACLSR